MKILISGGHLTPALALIDHFNQIRPDLQIVFAGRVYTQRKNKQLAQEYRLVRQKKNTVFEPFESGKWGVGNIFYKLGQVGLLIVNFPRAIYLFLKHKPKLFISFGGYLALPLSLAAKFTGVPIITHEQTRSFGLANQLIAKLANEVAVSYPESLNHFPRSKTTLTGNLIRVSIKQPVSQPTWFKLTTKKPILYVTGGSQGSEIINMTFAQVINQLLKKWIVIHQCGPQSKARNYARELENVKSNLSPKLKSHYFVKEWLNETELAWVYNHAHLAVGRAGANTVAELRLHQLPAILIPLSLAHNNEQMQNALSLTQAGGALIINQNELSPTKLLDTIDQAKSQLAKMKRNLAQLKPELNGVEKFAQLALKYLD